MFKGLRQHGICQVEVLPGIGRFPLCGTHPASRFDARALRDGTRPIDEFAYEEGVDGKDHTKYLWQRAYALGARLTQSFAKFGWCASIRGVENGGLVEGWPLITSAPMKATWR